MYVRIDIGGSYYALAPIDLIDSLMSDPRVEFVEAKWEKGGATLHHREIPPTTYRLETISSAQVNAIKAAARVGLDEEK